MPFVKLDCGLLDSSLWIDRNLRDVFITALLMAEPKEFSEPQRQIEVDTLNFTDFVAPPEWYGFCPAAGSGIVRRALVEPTAGMEALKQLGSADPESRNKKFDGRRMIRVNGGFLILNYMDFRDQDYTNSDLSGQQWWAFGGNNLAIGTLTANITLHDQIVNGVSWNRVCCYSYSTGAHPAAMFFRIEIYDGSSALQATAEWSVPYYWKTYA